MLKSIVSLSYHDDDKPNETAVSIMNQIKDGIIALDSDLYVKSLNKSALSIIKKVVGECDLIEGTSITDLIPDPAFIKAIRLSMQEKQEKSAGVKLPHHWKKNSQIVLDSVITPQLCPRKMIQGVLVIMREYEPLNKEAKELQSFIENISYELKTPITVIYGGNEILMHELRSYREAPNTTKARSAMKVFDQFIPVISQQVDNIRGLIERSILLLDIEMSSDLREKVSISDIEDVIKTSSLELENYADQNGVEIAFNSNTTSLSGRVKATKDHIKEAIYHLLHNAIHFSHRDGKVEIFVNVVSGSDLNEKEAICSYTDGYDRQFLSIQIQDYGIGIETRHLHSLTQRFFCVERSKSRKEAGHGLGLAIVDQIMKGHEGAVFLETALGEGSTFNLVIPLV